MEAGNALKPNLDKGASRVSRIVKELKKNKVLYLMIAPGVLLKLVFAYIPLVGILIAFEDFNYKKGIFGSEWIGLENFKLFFSSGKMWMLTRNTLFYNILFIVTGTIFNIILAIVISEMCTRRYKRTLQSIMMLPHFLSWVIVGGMAYNILNYEFGLLNNILSSLGFDKIDVYNNTGVWKYIFVVVSIWKESGYGIIYYLAAITGINPELYEAARVDGCGILQKIRYITLPMIKPTISILLLLRLGNILQGNMEMFYNLVGKNSYLYNATDVIDTYVYRTLMNLKDYGVTSAAGLYQNVIGFILVIVANQITKKLDADSSLF